MTEERNLVAVITSNKLLFEAISISLRKEYHCQLVIPSLDNGTSINQDRTGCILLDLDSEENLNEFLETLATTVFHVPTIILASEKDSAQVHEHIKSGAYDYLYIPFERNKLLTTVRNASMANLRMNKHKEVHRK